MMSPTQRAKLIAFIRTDQNLLVDIPKLETLDRSTLVLMGLVVLYRSGCPAEKMKENFVEPFGLDEGDLFEAVDRIGVILAKRN